LLSLFGSLSGGSELLIILLNYIIYKNQTLNF
jgi:hypothetical protein